MGKAVFLMVSILFLSSLGLAFSSVASTALGQTFESIYIYPDGRIMPSTAPIQQNGDIFTLTDNIIITSYQQGIVIMRDNTTLDGAGKVLDGPNVPESDVSAGIVVNSPVTNVTVQNLIIHHFAYGIRPLSSGNTFSHNNISQNDFGFFLIGGGSNKIEGNRIEKNNWGIGFYDSSNNSVSKNFFSNSFYDVDVWRVYDGTGSFNNRFYLNSFEGFNYRAGYQSYWDNGVMGNYWSKYNGTDSNQDGIGDTPYTIDANNIDHYPLMGTFQSFSVLPNKPPFSKLEEVEVISNSTIGNVNVSQTFEPTNYGWFIELTGVTGLEGTSGFCRITFPNDIINASYYQVLINGTFTSSNRIVGSNGTYTTVYFTYVHPVLDSRIEVFPEFPSFFILPLFFIATLLTATICRKRMRRY